MGASAELLAAMRALNDRLRDLLAEKDDPPSSETPARPRRRATFEVSDTPWSQNPELILEQSGGGHP